MVSLLVWMTVCANVAHSATPSAAGDLIITEVMASVGDSETSPIADFDGEWFEVYNASGEELDLSGLVIGGESGGDDPDDGFTVTGTLTVGVDGYVVFLVSDCADSVSCPVGYNGGLSPSLAYVYDRGLLDLDSDGPDRLRLTYDGVVLDTVSWDSSWDFVVDTTLQLGLSPEIAEWSNDLPQSWCAASSTYGDVGLVGTPGVANDVCPDFDEDSDGDGFTEDDGDCDDLDPYVRPSAVDGDVHDDSCGAYDDGEGCCGRANDDADCDGLRDDGTTDDDGDGFTEEDGDCDDTSDAVSPAGVEDGGIAGVDDDCDGCIDDTDADADGFSTCGTDSVVCPTAVPFDCDDGDASTNPDAEEVPSDTIDNDCDGVDRGDVDGAG